MQHTQQLLEVIGIQNYRGCLIHFENDKYRVFKEVFDTLQQAKDFIDTPVKFRFV